MTISTPMTRLTSHGMTDEAAGSGPGTGEAAGTGSDQAAEARTRSDQAAGPGAGVAEEQPHGAGR